MADHPTPQCLACKVDMVKDTTGELFCPECGWIPEPLVQIDSPNLNKIEISGGDIGRVLLHCDPEGTWFIHLGDQVVNLEHFRAALDESMELLDDYARLLNQGTPHIGDPGVSDTAHDLEDDRG